MSRLPDIPALPALPDPPDVRFFADELGRRNRQAAVDTVIRSTRAATPKAATEQRTQKRLSVEELNDLDEDVISKRLAATTHDDRPTAIKVLDWIDLPRNTIANIAAGDPTTKGVLESYIPAAGLGATAGAFVGGPVGAAIGAGVGAGANLLGQLGGAAIRGITGSQDLSEGKALATAGQKQITTSDALRAMGVENRVIRAIVGFAGDVAFDPLTYAGPAGWGAKATARTARGAVSIPLTKGYRKAISGASKAIARGEDVLDPTIKEAFRLEGLTPEWAAGLRTAGKGADEIASEASGRMLGSIGGGKVQRGLEIFGADRPFTDSFVGKHFFDYLYSDDAAKGIAGLGKETAEELAEKGAKGEAARAIARKFGRQGAEFAHVPFTDIALRFGRETLGEGGRAARLAKISGAVGLTPEFAELLDAGADVMRTVKGTSDIAPMAVREGTFGFDTPMAEYQNVSPLQDAADQLEALTARIDAASKAIKGSDATLDRAIMSSKVMDATSAARKRVRSLMDIKGLEDAGEVGEAVMDARAKAISAAKTLADASESSVVDLLNKGEREALDVVNTALGTTDNTIGASALRATSEALRSAFPDNQTAYAIADGMDRLRSGLHKTTGRRTGEGHQIVRRFERAMQEGADYEMSRAANEVVSDVSSVLKNSGIDPSDAGRLDDALNLMYAMVVNERHAESGAFHAKVWVPGKGPVDVSEYLKNPSKYPGADENFAVSVARAQQSGLLQDKQLTAALKELAKKHVSVFDELGDVAQEMELLGRPIMGYVANVPTPEFAKSARAAKSFVGDSRGGGDSLRALESFQKPRSTNQYRFQDAEGTWRRFFEYERAIYGKMGEEQFDAIRKSQGVNAEQHAREVQKTIAAYDSLENPPPGLLTDATELNSMVQNGRMGFLTRGGDLPNGAFSTNLATVIGARTAMQQRAAARKFLTEAVTDLGLSVDEELFNRLADPVNRGKPIRLDNGAVVKMGPTIDGLPSVDIAGKFFRPLDRAKIGKGHPLLEIDGDGSVLRRLYHEDLARELERAGDIYKPENAKALLQTYDKLLSVWKTITLTHPSWVIQDMFGMANQWISGGVKVDQALADLPKVAQAVWNSHKPETLKSIAFTLPDGRTIGADELMRTAAREGVINTSQQLETAAQLVNGDLMGLVNARADQARGALGTAKDVVTTPFTIVPESLGAMARGGPKAGATMFKDRAMRNYIAPWFRLNHRANDMMRLTAFLNYVGQGNSVDEAAALVRRHMFDFTDLTRTESKVGRRLIPFLSWVRSNAVYQTQQLLRQPGILATYPKVGRAVEEFINGDSSVPQQYRPSWMRDQLAMQIGRNPDNRFAVLMRSAVPAGDALEVLGSLMGAEGALDFMRYFGSAVSPIPKAAVELATGREIFSGRSIAASPTEGDIGLGEYALSQIRPLREFGIGSSRKAPLTKAYEQGVGPGVARSLIGGRVQPFDEERRAQGLLRQYQDEERGIRAAINRAERDGLRDLSVQSRVKLMALYRQMMNVGLADEVPEWAREQLSRLEAPRAPQGG